MDDNLYRDAISKRDELRDLIAKAMQTLDVVEKFINAYEQIQAAQEYSSPQVSELNLMRSPKTQRESRSARAAKIDAMMKVAEVLILEAGRPLSRSVLLRGLEERGFRIDGTDKSKVLGTNLWRSKRFHNLEGVGYWPLSHPIPDEFKKYQVRSSKL